MANMLDDRHAREMTKDLVHHPMNHAPAGLAFVAILLDLQCHHKQSRH